MFRKSSIACTEQTDLAIVECSLHGNVVYICVGDGSHLRFLNGRHTTLRMKDKNGDIGLVSESIDGSTVSSMNYGIYVKPSMCTYLPVSPLVAPTTVSFSGASFGPLRAFLRSKKNSKRFPNSCKATSLNANVGP